MPHRPANRKAQLADAAAELFGRHGYHAVSVNDIACAAGVTGPAVYRHFAGKRDVLAHVLRTGLEVFEQVSAEALAEGGLDGLLSAVAGLVVERREITALWRWQGSHLGRQDQAAIRRAGARIMDRWSAALRESRPDLAAADADLLCWAALSVFGSISVHHLSLPRKRFERLLAWLAAAVLDYSGLPAPEPASSGPARQRTPASRREELLSAATRLFRERGYHAVSMEDIGAAAGIAGPSIYRHFASKADILVAAGYRMGDRLHVDADRALREAADPADALDRLVRSYVDTVLRTGNLMAVFASESISMAERDAKELLRIQRSYVAEWVKLLIETAPALDEREARVTVHAALTIVNDLTRTPRLAARPGIAEELVALASVVLRAAAAAPG
ncbi:MAG TPA: TetR/AcrR family transcriptional regulator [Actinophytocola sp.]|uniref:TetR/AcrR family transcriptional regulator n=1 Tax=Actinophytocola sp. TaxID=1872138 RepID=UPI002DDCE157|nr:TetR/AcrR family transcriptional regulator [Actinophytocola sp.]HEV2780132.1 TetR/AcrR family transcriptional regulator [Actinophytocola sp.]